MNIFSTTRLTNKILTFQVNKDKMTKFGIVILLVFACFVSRAQQKPVLNHVAIYVVDLSKSTAFYKDVIGLDTMPEPFHDGKHSWFRIGKDTHLHIISGSAAATVHEKNVHLCFRVSSVTDFIPRLQKSGIIYEDVPGNKMTINLRPDGVKQIYFTDPDGYWIEINDAKD
jgi:lactoylglutathione lyase